MNERELLAICATLVWCENTSRGAVGAVSQAAKIIAAVDAHQDKTLAAQKASGALDLPPLHPQGAVDDSIGTTPTQR